MSIERKKVDIVIIFRYITMLFLILKTQSVFTFFTNVDLHINLLFVSSLTIFTILRVFNKSISLKPHKKLFIFLLVYYIYVIAYGIITKCFYRPYYVNYLVVFPLLILNIVGSKNYKDEIRNLTETFVNIVFAISIISLFFYIFGSILNIIQPIDKISISWGITKKIPSYYFLHYNTQYIDIFGYSIWRNSSIFTEAPMFSLCLSFALFYYMFFSKKTRNRFIVLTLVFALITTITFSAFLCLLLIYLMFLFEKIRKKLNKKTIILSLFILLLLILFSSILLIIRSKTSSISIRFDDLKATFKAFCDNVIFGVGMNNEKSIINYMSNFRNYNVGISNTIGIVLAEGGLYYMVFYILPFILLFNRKTNYKIIFFMIFILLTSFVFVYFSTPLILLNISILYSYTYYYFISRKEGVE